MNLIPKRQKPTNMGAKSCPECNSIKLVWDGWEKSVNVHCESCRFAGPIGVSKEEAVEKWDELPR